MAGKNRELPVRKVVEMKQQESLMADNLRLHLNHLICKWLVFVSRNIYRTQYMSLVIITRNMQWKEVREKKEKKEGKTSCSNCLSQCGKMIISYLNQCACTSCQITITFCDRTVTMEKYFDTIVNAQSTSIMILNQVLEIDNGTLVRKEMQTEVYSC